MRNGDHRQAWAREVSRAELFFWSLLVTGVCLSYGYEVFNFHLTIDEEIHASRGSLWREWASQGRWGMALLNFAVVRDSVAPVTSTLIGVLGVVVGLVMLVRDNFRLEPPAVAVIAALAVSMPTLPFALTFSTLSYGVGFGFIAVAFSSSLVTGKHSWSALILACILGAFAISVYQTFIFALSMLAAFHLWRCYSDEETFCGKRFARPVAFVLGAMVLYLVINAITLRWISADIKYVGQFVDIQGLFQDPLGRILKSAGRVAGIFAVDPSLFGIRTVWLAVALAFATVFSFVHFRVGKKRALGPWVFILAVLGVAVLADAIAPGGAPIRSQVYLPVAVALVMAASWEVCGSHRRHFLVALSCLAVIGNSQVNNRLFASSAAAEAQDGLLAQKVVEEIGKRGGVRLGDNLWVEVIGAHAWPSSPLLIKSETFGASFFEWDGGNRHRVAAYLRLHGLPAAGADDNDRAKLYESGRDMPAWPKEGWMSMVGNVLVLKFGPHSHAQRASLCMQGVSEVCD